MSIRLIFTLSKSASSPFFSYVYYHLKVLKWLSSPSFILSLSIGTTTFIFPWAAPRLPLGYAAVCQTSGPGVKPWPPTSQGIVCAWGLCPAFWCCRSAEWPWWRSDGAEAGSLAACLPAEGPLDAGSPQSLAEPRGENPGAFGQPRYSLCAWSLEQEEWWIGKEEGKIIYINLSYTLDDIIQCNVNILKSRSTAATATWCFAALDSAGCLCKRAILERGFLLLVVNDAP